MKREWSVLTTGARSRACFNVHGDVFDLSQRGGSGTDERGVEDADRAEASAHTGGNGHGEVLEWVPFSGTELRGEATTVKRDAEVLSEVFAGIL